MLFALETLRDEYIKYRVTSGSCGYTTSPRGVDWHIVVDAGALADLGWDIKYYNRD